MIKRIGFLIIALCFSFNLFAADKALGPSALSFKDFYKQVLAYYPKLKRQNVDVTIAIAQKAIAVTGFMPSLQGASSVSRGDDPVFEFSSLLREGAFTADDFALSRLNTPSPRTTYNFSLYAQLPIFNAFQTVYKLRQARLRLGAAYDEEAFTRMEAFFIASDAYLRAMATERLFAVTEEVLKASNDDLLQARELKDKGVILGADFYAAKAMQGNIAQLKNQLAQDKKSAYILLNILMGHDPFTSWVLTGDLAVGDSGGVELKSWLDSAYKMRPDLAAVEKMVIVAGIDLKRQKASMLPKINAFGAATNDRHSLRNGGGNNYIVGLKADVDIFDPAYFPRIQAAQAQLKKIMLDRDSLKDSITQDLANECARFQAMGDNRLLAQEMFDDSKQAIDLMVPLYQEGKKSIADLFQIRCAYLNSAKNYYNLAANIKASKARLLFLSGQLDDKNIDEFVRLIGGNNGQ